MTPDSTIFLLAAEPIPLSTLVSNVLDPQIWTFLVAFVVAILLTPVMRWLAVRGGIIDWPDLKRKSHIEPVAYLGGAAIFLAWAFGLTLGIFIPAHAEHGAATHVAFPFSIFLGATVVVVTGLCDDLYGISPRVKIGGQILAAAALSRMDVGWRLADQSFIALGVNLPPTVTYWIGMAVILLFVIGGCNAMNLIDGLDGLAAGVAAIACLAFLFVATFVAVLHLNSTSPASIAAHLTSDPLRLAMCMALLGALLGFLPYNFNPASIFMGDAGSLLVGFLCATTILLFANVPVFGPKLVMACLIIFALPISDTSLAIFRRFMRGQPIFSPDSQHLHHVLIRAGMTVRKAVVTLYALAFFFAILGCSLVFVPWRYVITVFLVIFGFVLVTAYKIGHRQYVRQKLAMTQHAPIAPAPSIPPTAVPQGGPRVSGQ